MLLYFDAQNGKFIGGTISKNKQLTLRIIKRLNVNFLSLTSAKQTFGGGGSNYPQPRISQSAAKPRKKFP
jgi:hypothetical protein